VLEAARTHRCGLLTLDDRLAAPRARLGSRSSSDAMKIYTYSQARQQLASLLDQVVREGSVRIRRRDGPSSASSR